MREHHSDSNGVAAIDLVNGPVAKTLFMFSFPFMLSTLLQTAYSTTDTIIVGQFLQQEGLSAVSTGSQIMQMMYSVCIGFSNAGQVLVAQAKGAGKHNKLEQIIGTLFVLEILLSIFVGGICIVFSGRLLRIMNIPPEAYVQARYYLIISGIGVLFTGLYNMFSSVLRGMGDSRHPLLFVGRMINALGVTVSAAFGVMQKMRSIPGFITQGFGLGSASMIGQNLGARKIERVNSVVKYCILFTVMIDIIFGSLYLLVPMFWFRIFTQDADVLSYAAMVMLALVIEIPASCFIPACNSLVSAQGFVRLSFTVAMLDAFAGRIFFCWLFGDFFHMQAFG